MENKFILFLKRWALVFFTFCVIVLLVLFYGGYLYRELYLKNLDLSKEVSLLNNHLVLLKTDLAEATSSLATQIKINDSFVGQIKNITSDVEQLDKLSKTDKELLKKYSKVFFLSENYVPDYLIEIDKTYLFNPQKTTLLHSKAYPFLEQMLRAASSSDLDIKIISGYRSFSEQTSLKSNYKVVYGSGANSFSADQGYSEHQLGTTVDLTTKELGNNYAAFAKTDSYVWLLDNAYRYGFVISYPKSNFYYQFEPWHWRFVGVELATYLYQEKKYFYDLSQRVIDGYLINIFDDKVN